MQLTLFCRRALLKLLLTIQFAWYLEMLTSGQGGGLLQRRMEAVLLMLH
jgi:hypothetical protein